MVVLEMEKISAFEKHLDIKSVRINELSELEIGTRNNFWDWDSFRRADGSAFGCDVEH